MKRQIYCFSILIFAFQLSVQSTFSQDSSDVYLPDLLPDLEFGDHVCGTTILLGIPDIAELQLDFLNSRSKTSSYSTSEAAVGDKKTFNVFNFEDSNGLIQEYDPIEFELRSVGDLSEIWVEIDELGDGKITQDVVDAVMNALENETPSGSFDPNRGIIDINQHLFGDAPDVDGSGKVKVLLVDIQDGWDPETGGGFIAGFFNPGDLNPALPTNNSNEADIIYIDTYPGIYRDNQAAHPERPLNVVAHEYQHLIHANYGNLIVFQNEAQSEVSEMINGFGARSMRFLEKKEEISGNVTSGSGSGLYRWRRSDMNSVLMDYQRAGLLHGYLHERVGAQATGSITRSQSSGKAAYEDALDAAGIEWAEFLAGFYAANRVNNPALSDGRFGYGNAAFAGVKATGLGGTYNSSEGENLEEAEVTLTYGGAKYTLWENTRDLRLNLSDNGEILYYAITLADGETANRVEKLDTGATRFTGEFDSIVLAAINTMERDNNEANPGTRSYTYSTGQTTDAGNGKELVSRYELLGNYPNPFNPATTIRYKLPETAHVRIDVYDVTGRRVATPVNDLRDEGSHNEIFQAHGLAGGVYIYRLQAGDFFRTRKMMLVK